MSTQVGLNAKGKSSVTCGIGTLHELGGLPSCSHGGAFLWDSSKVTLVAIISVFLAFTFSGV